MRKRWDSVLGENDMPGFAETSQAVYIGDEDILNPPILQFGDVAQ
jgi:hypothetical protein